MLNHTFVAVDAAKEAVRAGLRLKAATKRVEAQESIRRAVVVARTGVVRSQEHIAKVREMQKRHWAKAWDGQESDGEPLQEQSED